VLVGLTMDVIFRRTGERRYAVIVQVPGRPAQVMDPAPGFDPSIPHDLVHYLVEAELGMESGVFGRAARGGGTFIPAAATGQTAREKARSRRKQLRREGSLSHDDELRGQQMESSERLAGICDLFWRRRHGQTADPSRPAPATALSAEDAGRVARVVERLDAVAPIWNGLPVGGEMVFEWPGVGARLEERP